MRKIEVFYHLYIPDSANSCMWVWWVDEQLSAIKKSKLDEHAKINIAITMPIFKDNLYADVKSYISLRYPFANILNIRDTGVENIYEGHALSYLYDVCLTKDIDVLYFHSKGSGYFNMYSSSWRQMLNHFCITRWQDCIERLKNVDVVGVSDPCIKNGRFKIDSFTSGNFWWATSEHVRQLKHPLSSPIITDRYAYEHWILRTRGTVDYIYEIPVSPEDNFCFIEDLS